MTIYRVFSSPKTIWTVDLDDALATAHDWAVAMAQHKVTGEVEVAHLIVGARGPQKLVDALNGLIPMRRRWYVRFEQGVPVEEYKQIKRHVRAKVMPAYTTVHPSPKHADWVDTIMRRVSGYQEIFRKAPDPKTALIALRLAKADKSFGGHKLTLDIAEYLWKWTNCSTPKRKRVR